MKLASNAVLKELFFTCLGFIWDFLVRAQGLTSTTKCLKCPDFLLPPDWSGEVLIAKFTLVSIQIPNQMLISIKILPA